MESPWKPVIKELDQRLRGYELQWNLSGRTTLWFDHYGYFWKVVEEIDVVYLAEANLQWALNMGYLPN